MYAYIKKQKMLPIVFTVSLMCTGIFYEYLSCAFSMFLLVLLFIKVKKEKQFIWRWNLISVTLVSFLLMYTISSIWAVDSGMAFLGVFKYLPVLLFWANLMQEPESAEKITGILPYVAGALTILSIIAMQIPALNSYFSVAGRLAGFFQYPNTYALFILVAELLLIGQLKHKLWDYLTLVVLLLGLLMTGSRTVFVLAVLSNLVFFLFHKNKRIKIVGAVSIALIIVAVLVFVLAFDGVGVVERYLQLSVKESTFIGRILYFADALPVILKNPFGLGYMGYYYIQQTIQTGFYSVRYVHNDFLQIMLDIGWLPCVLLVVAIGKSIFYKKTTFHQKIILSVIFLHSCFDFNLQFIAMFCLLLLFMDHKSGKKILVRKQLLWVKSSIVAAGWMCFYIGVSLALFQMEKYDHALKVYPWNTQVQVMMLTEIEDLEQADKIADSILERNEYVTLAYSIKSRSAYAKGDFGNVITYKNTLLEKAPFQYDEYEEYCYMLVNGISLYTKAGDMGSADLCKQELLAIPRKLAQAEQRISTLGKMIKDQPTTELPEDIKNYINRLEGAN